MQRHPGRHGAKRHPYRREMKIDMRFEKMAEMNRVMEAAKEICAQTHVEGTSYPVGTAGHLCRCLK